MSPELPPSDHRKRFALRSYAQEIATTTTTTTTKKTKKKKAMQTVVIK